jgi:cytochrome b561
MIAAMPELVSPEPVLIESVWTRPARIVHWSTAIAMMVEVPFGFIMAWSYGPAQKNADAAALHIRASQIHHTLGMLLLALVFFRIWWRLGHRAPALPAGTTGLVRLAPRLVQALLYALLMALPLSGWAALSSMAASGGYAAPPMWFFTHNGFGEGGLIPHIVAPKPWNDPGLLTYGIFAQAHVWFVWIGGAALLAHIAGALWHHFVRRDDVLRRMITSRKQQEKA